MKSLVTFFCIIGISFPPIAMSSDKVYFSEVKFENNQTCSPVLKPVIYVVEASDHLADIIRTFGFKPLYGKKSRVTQVSELNEISDPNLIVPEQEIYLPFKCEKDTEKYVLLDRGRDRQIDPRHLVKVKTQIARGTGKQRTVMRLPNNQVVEFKKDALPKPDQGNFATRISALYLLSGFTEPAPSTSAQEPSSTRDIASQDSQESAGESQGSSSNVIPKSLQFKPHTAFSLDGLYGFYRIDSTDNDDGSRAQLLSRPSLGVQLGWQHLWTEKFTSGILLSHRNIEMRRATLGTLNDGKQSLGGMRLFANYKWTSKFRSILGVRYDEQFFVRSLQSGTATLDLYQQPSVDLSLQQQLIQVGSLAIDLTGGYRQLFKSSTESATMFDSGEYLMGLQFRQQLERMQVQLKLNYLKGQQKTSLSTQENSGIDAQIGITMEIGK